jgi:hypothetical protein
MGRSVSFAAGTVALAPGPDYPVSDNWRTTMPAPDEKTQTELEAAAFRRLIEHLRKRSDVQNIDLMNLSGFCRNCLANWYQQAADAKGLAVTKDEAREMVYGMPYEEWRAKHQKEASAEQRSAFEKSHKH